jgi:hypothetical protein
VELIQNALSMHPDFIQTSSRSRSEFSQEPFASSQNSFRSPSEPLAMTTCRANLVGSVARGTHHMRIYGASLNRSFAGQVHQDFEVRNRRMSG